MSGLTELSSIKFFDGIQKRYSHYSRENDWEMKFAVYLPPQCLKGEKCPVMIWLTGRTLGEFGFTNKSGVQRHAAKYGMIIAAPEPTPRGIEQPLEDGKLPFGAQLGFYVDSIQEPWCKHYRMYSYIVKEFYQIMLDNFPVIPNKIGLSGHSMGGTSSIPIGLRNPDKFASITSLSGDYNPSASEDGRDPFTLYLGEDRDLWKENDATEVVKRYRGPARTILIDSGGSDPVLDKFAQKSLFKACYGTNISLVNRIHVGYHHAYEFIQTFVEDHVKFHMKIFETIA